VLEEGVRGPNLEGFAFKAVHISKNLIQLSGLEALD
jgi:hypothetical protein